MFFSLLQHRSQNSHTPTAASVVVDVCETASSSSSSSRMDGSCDTTNAYSVVISAMQQFYIVQHILRVLEQINKVYTVISTSIHPFHVVGLILFGFYLVPTIQSIHQTSFPTTNNEKGSRTKPFHSTLIYILCDNISQISRIALVVYVIDFVINVIVEVAFNEDDDDEILKHNNISHVIAKVLYVSWFAQRLSVLKRCIFEHIVNAIYSKVVVNANSKYININSAKTNIVTTQSKRSMQFGTFMVLDRLFDTLIYAGAGMLLLDIIDMEMKQFTYDTNNVTVTKSDKNTNVHNIQSIRSLLAIGSATTVIVGILIKDLGSMLVNGFTLSTTNRLAIGDDVKFGDGTTGVIQNIGWIQTTIIHYDNLIEFVPNNILGMQRVKNITRTNQCRIQQALRFRYDDALVLPKVLDDIINEIKVSCPELISDGSRPLRAVVTEFCETYIKVIVTAHFNIRPIGKKFCHNREQCLLAMYRAVHKNDISFVTSFNIEGATTKASGVGGISPNLDLGSCR